jgi:sn-glycerol 3-phosphate transport system substrate-binding protein
MPTRGRARLLAAVLTVGALVAAACGDGDDGGGGGGGGGEGALPECPIEALEQAQEPVEVVLWHFLVAKTEEALAQIVDEYNASQSKVRVRIESQGTSNDELFAKYRAGIGSGDLPAIAVVDDTVTRQMIDSGTVLPAQSCIEATGYDMSDFVAGARDYYTIDGTLYPSSLSLSSALLYYNKNHFRRAELDPETTPQTLDEVREYAETIKAAGVVETPVVLKVSPPILEMWLTGAGQPVVDNDNGRGPGETTEATFDTDTTVGLYAWVQAMVADGLMQAVPDTPGQINHYLALAQQNGSMTIETSTAATTVEAFLGGDTSVAADVAPGADAGSIDLAALDIGAAEVPGIDAVGRIAMGGGAWYVTNTSPPEVQAAAWDFLTYFNDLDSQVTWNLVGSYLPYRISAADDPRVQERWTTTMAGRWLAVAYDQLLTGIDPEFPGPLMGPYEQFRQSLRDSVDEVIFRGATPADAVAGAAEETTAALQQYNDESF